MSNYKLKYIKYKKKYLNLVKLLGGSIGFGSIVRIIGLMNESAKQYNGSHAIIVSNLNSDGRFIIKVLINPDQIKIMNIKPSNIEEIDETSISPESVKLHKIQLIGTFVQIHSLVKETKFNDTYGIITDFVYDIDRFNVKFSYEGKDYKYKFKIKNLNMISKEQIDDKISSHLNYLLSTTLLKIEDLKNLQNKPNKGTINFHNHKTLKKYLLELINDEHDQKLRSYGYVESVHSKFKNLALKSFSINFTIHVMEEFHKFNPEIPCVSIGSGVGLLEFIYEQSTKLKLICIDPDPLGWNNDHPQKITQPFRAPDYKNVDEYISRNESVINKCTLLLNWCYPGIEYGYYDFEAITKLRPLAFLVLFEQFGDAGSAGSKMFHDFINSSQTVYKCVHLISLDKSKKNYNIQWWQRSDISLPTSIKLPDVVESLSLNYSIDNEISLLRKMKMSGAVNQDLFDFLLDLITNYNYSIDEYLVDSEQNGMTREQIIAKLRK